MLIASAKSRSVKGASYQAANFEGEAWSWLLVKKVYCDIYVLS